MVSPFGIPLSPEDEPQQATPYGIPLSPQDEPEPKSWMSAASNIPLAPENEPIAPAQPQSDLDRRLAAMASQWEGRRYVDTGGQPVGISIQPEAVGGLYDWFNKYGQYGPLGAGIRGALSPVEFTKETFGAATTPLLSYSDIERGPGEDIVRNIVERAGTPATYIGGFAPAGLTIAGAGLGTTAEKITAAAGGGETAQEIARLAGELAPFGLDIYHLGRGVYNVGGKLYRIVDGKLSAIVGEDAAALRQAVPESFQFGRGQTLEEFGGFPRQPVSGAADLSNLSDDAINQSINAARKAQREGKPVAEGLIEDLYAEVDRRAKERFIDFSTAENGDEILAAVREELPGRLMTASASTRGAANGYIIYNEPTDTVYRALNKTGSQWSKWDETAKEWVKSKRPPQAQTSSENYYLKGFTRAEAAPPASQAQELPIPTSQPITPVEQVAARRAGGATESAAAEGAFVPPSAAEEAAGVAGTTGETALGRAGRIARSAIPGPVRATPGITEEGVRVGNLLRPRTLEQLGPEPSVRNVLEVADDLARQVGSQNVSLGAEIDSANRVLGPTVKDAQGNVRLRNVIKPDGAPAIKQDVLENPGRYNLTPEQLDAVNRLQNVAKTVRNEAKTFNVDVKETLLQEGQNYIPRRVVSVAGDEALQKPGNVSAQRLTKLREQARTYTDPLEAVNKGVVYDDPVESLKSYVNSNLQGSANQHIIDSLKEFGVSDPSEFLRKARVSDQAAPTLSGLYFDPKDAKSITRYYSRGMAPENTIGDVVNIIKKFNRNVVPWQAIGDASATLKQLGTVLPSKPVTFAKNFGQSFVDAWGGWKNYQEWLSSPEVRDAASHGVNIVGEKSPGTTDFWASWAEQVPGLKQTQRQFESIGNRNRVALYQQDLDMLRRTGQPVDELAMEQVARNANRITGTSNTRATDIESLAEFAPNFLRARFETIGKALADGTIEGDLARKYMSNYIFAGLSAVTAAALYQNRNLKEVLSPITVSPNGRFKWNPNFGTIRVGDTDVDVFSQFSGLARMFLTASDAMWGGVKEQDVGQLVGGLYNSVMSLESPSASIIDALVRASYGATAYGEDPKTLAFWVRKPMPIGAAQTLQSIQAGQSPLQIGVSQGAQFFGARAGALTPTEMAQAGKYEELGVIPQFRAINAQSWKAIKEQAPSKLQEEMKEYNSFYDWEQGTRIKYTKLATQEAQEKNIDPALIPGAVDKAIQQSPIYKAQANARDYYETKWVTEHPQEAYNLWVEERKKTKPSWLPTKKQQEIILRGVKQ